MDGGIITLPLRAGVGSMRLLLRAGVDVAGCAVRVGGKLADQAFAAARQPSSRTFDVPPARPLDDRAKPAAVAEVPPAPVVEEPVAPAPVDDAAAAPAPAIEEPTVPAPVAEEPAAPVPAADEQPEPVHVSEEPELVSEVAEAGAEDGAGASITIAEPWPGYDRMQARQVISRLAGATPAELAAVQLYESSNRDRQSVRAAAQRSLKIKSGRGSPDREE